VTLGHIYALQGFSSDSRIGQKVSETMVPESGGSGEVDEDSVNFLCLQEVVATKNEIFQIGNILVF